MRVRDVRFAWTAYSQEPEVLAIERASFARPLTASTLRPWLLWEGFPRIALAAVCHDTGEWSGRVVGHALYEVRPGRVRLARLVVHPQLRRAGVGRRLAGAVLARTRHHFTDRLVAAVREQDLSAQLFLRSCGFVAVGVTGGKIRFEARRVAGMTPATRAKGVSA